MSEIPQRPSNIAAYDEDDVLKLQSHIESCLARANQVVAMISPASKKRIRLTLLTELERITRQHHQNVASELAEYLVTTAGLSQKDICERCEFSASMLSQVLSKTKHFGVKNAHRLMSCFREQLLGTFPSVVEEDGECSNQAFRHSMQYCKETIPGCSQASLVKLSREVHLILRYFNSAFLLVGNTRTVLDPGPALKAVGNSLGVQNQYLLSLNDIQNVYSSWALPYEFVKQAAGGAS